MLSRIPQNLSKFKMETFLHRGFLGNFLEKFPSSSQLFFKFSLEIIIIKCSRNCKYSSKLGLKFMITANPFMKIRENIRIYFEIGEK